MNDEEIIDEMNKNKLQKVELDEYGKLVFIYKDFHVEVSGECCWAQIKHIDMNILEKRRKIKDIDKLLAKEFDTKNSILNIQSYNNLYKRRKELLEKEGLDL